MTAPRSTPYPAPPGHLWRRQPVEGVEPVSMVSRDRKCSKRVDWTNRHNACGAVAVAREDGDLRCAQHLDPAIWISSGVAWCWVLTQEEEIVQEELTLIGGPGHGSTVLLSPEAASWQGDLGRYERRTMRFMERSATNPRSVTLRRYWVADVLVHEAIADDTAEAYGWWQSLADARMFEAVGRDVTDDPEEVALFHPKQGDPS